MILLGFSFYLCLKVYVLRSCFVLFFSSLRVDISTILWQNLSIYLLPMYLMKRNQPKFHQNQQQHYHSHRKNGSIPLSKRNKPLINRHQCWNLWAWRMHFYGEFVQNSSLGKYVLWMILWMYQSFLSIYPCYYGKSSTFHFLFQGKQQK